MSEWKPKDPKPEEPEEGGEIQVKDDEKKEVTRADFDLAAKKIMQARCRLMTKEPWYGHIAMMFEWKADLMENQRWRTMGVYIVNRGLVRCLYNPEFINTLSLEELYCIVVHEIQHVVRLHCFRSGQRDPEGWNIAADMTCNGTLDDPRIAYQKHGGKTILPNDGKGMIWIPQGWANDGTAEGYYKIMEETPVPKKGDKGEGKCKGKGKGDGKGENKGKDKGEGEDEGEGGKDQPGDGFGPKSEFNGYSGKTLDNHDLWRKSTVSKDEARQIVKNMTDQATAKCRGRAPGNLVEALRELGKPIVRWREILRQFIGRHVGNRRWTYSRRNRRLDIFGLKGISRRAAATVNVIIDTSGSIAPKELEQFFAEIEAMAYRTRVGILQWDHAYQGYEANYRRGGWKKIKIRGRGGTDMSAPIDWLLENGVMADCTIMLTDGYCNWHEPCKFPMITVITSKKNRITEPGWGDVVYMDIHD